MNPLIYNFSSVASLVDGSFHVFYTSLNLSGLSILKMFSNTFLVLLLLHICILCIFKTEDIHDCVMGLFL